MRRNKEIFRAATFGPLPVDLVNQLLHTELDPGNVYLSEQAHRHIALDHADDYPHCFPHLADAIKNPTYIGQDPRHASNFIIIKRIRTTDGMDNILVAISLELDDRGAYRIKSVYREKPHKIEIRRQKGHLHMPIRR